MQKWSARGDLCRRKGANAMKAGKRARYILAALAVAVAASALTVTALLALAFATLVGLLSGIMPAGRAVKISALEAIRHE